MPLLKIFGEVWESERVPVDFLKGLITIIDPKKSDTSMISWINIKLRSTTSKLFQILAKLSREVWKLPSCVRISVVSGKLGHSAGHVI